MPTPSQSSSPLRPIPTSCRVSTSPSGSRRSAGKRRGPGAVAVHPVGVGDALAPAVGPRGELHPPGPRLAVALVTYEGGGDAVAIAAFEAARQYRGILDRHRRALRHV